MPHRSYEALAHACRRQIGTAADHTMQRAISAFLQHAAMNPSLLDQAASSLRNLPPWGAVWMAAVLGAAIEHGAKAEASATAVFDLFESWLEEVFNTDNGGDARRWSRSGGKQQGVCFDHFPMLCQAVVSHLARLPAQREAWAKNETLLDQLQVLEDQCDGAVWVRHAILKSSGGLVVLHPPSAAGCKLRYSNVANCFHLFSLLQTAIGSGLAGGREPAQLVYDAARGQQDGCVRDQAWWHYGRPDMPRQDLMGSIWGEQMVRDLPVVDGVKVILLWPTLLGSRGWDSSFFAPHIEQLPADLVVEAKLSDVATRAWMRRLRVLP